jgi:ElaB/YqjD/DUF883 family membrane-anchored ribosome-binding protein
MANVAESDRGTQTQDTAEKAQQKGSQMLDEAQRQTKEVATQAQQQAKSMLSTRKNQAARELDNVSQAFRQTSDQLRSRDEGTVAHYTDRMATQIDRASAYLNERTVEEIVDDTENFVRRRPELVIGGAFALGLLTTRFLKSSNQPRQETRRYPEQRRTDVTRSHDRADWEQRREEVRSQVTEEW